MELVLDQVAASWPAHAVRSATPDMLGAILMPHINLAIWERDDPPEVPDPALLDEIDDIDFTGSTGEMSDLAREALEAAGYPATCLDPLARDIARNAARLAELLDRETVTVRLEMIETDACRRFHADYVSVRLIATLAGPGTQWLDADDAALLQAGTAPTALAVREIATGHVALFKGREWAPGSAIVHRSPPIADTGVRRLVLVIDPASPVTDG